MMAKVKRRDYKKSAAELASRVIWALKFMRTSSPGGVVATEDGKLTPWEHWFMDALDDVGYSIGRKKYFENRSNKRRK